MQKKKILFVDDSASIRTLVKIILNEAGYDVTLGEDGKDALQYLDGRHFDLIITDLHMPHMDGLELITAIRQKNEYRFVPILFLTTETKSELKQKAKKAGATGWITKPFDKTKLLQIIKKVIR